MTAAEMIAYIGDKAELAALREIVTELAAERDGLRAELEAALAAGIRWTYTADKEPPTGVDLILTIVYGKKGYIRHGRYNPEYAPGDRFMADDGIIFASDAIAWALEPQPAALREVEAR